MTGHESAVFPTHILYLGCKPEYINDRLSISDYPFKHFILDCFYLSERTTTSPIDKLSDDHF